MTFASWITSSGLTDAECARQIGVTRQALSRYKAHARFPRPEILKRINELTSGQVTANDFAAQPVEVAA